MIKKYLLYILSLFLLLIIILSTADRDSYRMGAEDVLENSSSQDYILTMEQLAAWGENNNTIPVYLGNPEDLPEEFLPGSVNLPLKDLSVNRIHESLSRSGRYLLYSEVLSVSCQAWVLLTQMGYENVFVLDRD